MQNVLASLQGYEPVAEAGRGGVSSSSLDAVPERLVSLNGDDEDGLARTQQADSNNSVNCGGILYYGLLIIVALSCAAALVISLISADSGGQPLEVESSYPFMTTIHHLRPTALWGKVSTPYPTGAWFTNLALEAGKDPVAPLPYAVAVTEDGVGVSYSAARRLVSSRRIQDGFMGDLLVTATEKYLTRYITDYGNLSVSMQMDYAGGGGMTVHLVRGSPYVTFRYSMATPYIGSDASFLKVNGEDVDKGAELHGNAFKVMLSNWETWMIFTSESVTMKFKTTHAEVMGAFNGVLRVAMLPHSWDKDAENLLTKHADAYAVGGRVQYAVLADRMSVKYIWDKEGFGDLLMLALPHHMAMMNPKTTTIVMPESYQTIKGKMTGILGSSWELTDKLTTIDWKAPVPLKESNATAVQREQMRITIRRDINDQIPTAPDPYGFGKQCARMARLSLIAEELEDQGIKTKALDLIEHAMAAWLGNDNADLLVYDKTWGGIVTLNGLNDVNADFGNANYNDHHFHYGYFLYAAAVIIRSRPDFWNTWEEQLTWLASDIVSDGTLSANFPFSRHKDWFDGHSWASGLFTQANGKSQESISEAVNAYYGAYLLGKVTKNKQMEDFCHVLLQMELRAAHTYWQMRHNSPIYDPVFSANRMVGVVASTEVVQLTWFGDKAEWVHGINMLPFTPITEALIPKDYVQQEWAYLRHVFERDDPPGPQWAGYCYLVKAVVDKQQAWSDVMALDIYDSANSKTNSLWWVATRPGPAEGASDYNPDDYEWPVKVASSCKLNSACYAQGLTSQCCPNEYGDFLSCCPSVSEGGEGGSAMCSANQACNDLGLTEGLCCPTLTGMFMSCCPGAEPAPPKEDENSIAACKNHPLCVPLKLEGDCCPTRLGDYLECCGVAPTAAATTKDKKVASTTTATTTTQAVAAGAVGGDNGQDSSCAAYTDCAGLLGDCCPTSAGRMLDCCYS